MVRNPFGARFIFPETKSKVPPTPIVAFTLGHFFTLREIQSSCFGQPYAKNKILGFELLICSIISLSSFFCGEPGVAPTIFRFGYFF